MQALAPTCVPPPMAGREPPPCCWTRWAASCAVQRHTTPWGARSRPPTRWAPAGAPLGRPIGAAYTLVRDGSTAIVEAAAASGLGLVSETEHDAEAASSAGT